MPSAMDVRFSLEVPAGPFAAATARRSLDAMRRYVERETFEDLRLLLSELVTNSSRHAGLGEGEPITIHVRASTGSVHAEVCDAGRGFDPASTKPTDTSGWGLRLVEQLSSGWGVRSDGGRTVVWFDIAPDRRLSLNNDSRRRRRDEATAS